MTHIVGNAITPKPMPNGDHFYDTITEVFYNFSILGLNKEKLTRVGFEPMTSGL